MTKAFLQSFRNRRYEARQIRARLEEMESRMYSPKAQALTGMPSAPSGGSALDGMVDSHVRLMEKYQAMLDALDADQLVIEEAMTGLEPKERMIIRCRYMDLMKWEDIAYSTNFSWAQVHRIHGAALRKLDFSGVLDTRTKTAKTFCILE